MQCNRNIALQRAVLELVGGGPGCSPGVGGRWSWVQCNRNIALQRAVLELVGGGHGCSVTGTLLCREQSWSWWAVVLGAVLELVGGGHGCSVTGT